jgi:hypothetical protein
MSIKSYIIRFPSDQSRSKFRRALEEERIQLSPFQFEVGEFLPDIIVKNVSDNTVSRLKQITDPGTIFFEDFQHDLFRR